MTKYLKQSTVGQKIPCTCNREFQYFPMRTGLFLQEASIPATVILYNKQLYAIEMAEAHKNGRLEEKRVTPIEVLRPVKIK